MAWWDNIDGGLYGNYSSDLYKKKAQTTLDKWSQGQQLAANKKDSSSILGWAAHGAKKSLGSLGGLLEEGGTGLMKGLDWYDTHAVAPVWDNAMKGDVALVLGRKPSEMPKYKDLTGWQRFGAGLISDPLNFIPVGGAAAKSLKGAAAAREMTGLARAAGSVERSLNLVNDAANLPIVGAGKALKYGGMGVGKTLERTPVIGSVATEFFRGMGRDVTEKIAARDGLMAFRYGDAAVSEYLPAGQDLTTASNETVRSTLLKIQEQGDKYYAALRQANKTGDRTLLDSVQELSPNANRAYQYIRGGGSRTTKRVFEQFRRITTQTARSKVKWNDAVQGSVDQWVKEFKYGGEAESTVLSRLADFAGNDELATKIMLGDQEALNSPLYRSMSQWLERRTTEAVPFVSNLSGETGTDVLKSFSKQVYENAAREIEQGTTATRAWMGKMGGFAESADPYHKRIWTNGMDKYLVRPVSTLVLGFPFFVVGNVIEDLSMSSMGGANMLGRSRWRMPVDDFVNRIRMLGPEFEVPESLTEGFLRDFKEFSYQGSMNPLEGVAADGVQKTPTLSNKAYGIVSGKTLLDKANTISADIRRSYWTKRWMNHMDGLKISDVLVPTHRGYEAMSPELRERTQQALAFSLGNPNATFNDIKSSIVNAQTDEEAIKQIIHDAGLPTETREFLKNNATGLANDASRDQILEQAAEQGFKEISRNMEHAGGLADKFVTDLTNEIGSITDPDQLMQAVHSYIDAEDIVAQLFTNYRTNAAKLGSTGNTVLQHEYNLTNLRRVEELQSRLNEAVSKGLPAAVKKLGTDKSLSPDIINRYNELLGVQQKRSLLLKERQKALYAASKPKMTPQELFKARDAVYQQFDQAIRAVDEEVLQARHMALRTQPSNITVTTGAAGEALAPERGAKTIVTSNADYRPTLGGGALIEPGKLPTRMKMTEPELVASGQGGEHITKDVTSDVADMAKDNPSAVRLRDAQESFDRSIGQAAAHGPVVIGIKVDDGVHPDNLDFIRTFFDRPGLSHLPIGVTVQGGEFRNVIRTQLEELGFTVGYNEQADFTIALTKKFNNARHSGKTLVIGDRELTDSGKIMAKTDRRGAPLSVQEAPMRVSEEVRQAQERLANPQEFAARSRTATPEERATWSPNQRPTIERPTNVAAESTAAQHALGGAAGPGIIGEEQLAQATRAEEAQRLAEDLKAALKDSQLFPKNKSKKALAQISNELAPVESADPVGEFLSNLERLTRDVDSDGLGVGLAQLYEHLVEYASPAEQQKIAGVFANVFSSSRGREVAKGWAKKKVAAGAMSETPTPTGATPTYAGVEKNATRPDLPGNRPAPDLGLAGQGRETPEMAARKSRLDTEDEIARQLEQNPNLPYRGANTPQESLISPGMQAYLERRQRPGYGSKKPSSGEEVAPKSSHEGGVPPVEPPAPPVPPNPMDDGEWFHIDTPEGQGQFEALLDHVDPPPQAVVVTVAMNEEKAARELAARSRIPVEQARSLIADESAMAQLLNDPAAFQGKLKDWGSVFGRVNPSKVPASELGRYYSEYQQNFVNLAKVLQMSDNFKGLAPETSSALDEVINASLAARKARNPEELRAALREATARATEDYHRYFTNYDDAKGIHAVMRHVFPFWRYESQRWGRITTVATRHPWFVSNYHRFMNASEDGTVTLPGTDLRFNPAAGGMFAMFTKVMKDGGWTNPVASGANSWDQLKSLMSMGGFYPGVSMAPAAYAVTKALDEPVDLKEVVGAEMPTAVSVAMNTMRAGGDVPILKATGFPDMATDFQETFPTGFQRYYQDTELINKGIHPFKATPEEQAAAGRTAAGDTALQQATGSMFTHRPQVRKDMMKQQAEEAKRLGVPDKDIANALRHNDNPLDAVDSKGTRYLDRSTVADLNKQHPEWDSLKALSSSFKSERDRALAGEKFRVFELKTELRKDLEDELLPAYRAFASGQMNGSQFRDARKATMDKWQGALAMVDKQYPKSSQAATLADPGDEQRRDVIRDMYFTLEADMKADGTLDYDGLKVKQAQLFAATGASKSEIAYVTKTNDKWKSAFMNDVESEYAKAKTAMEDYQSLPKFPGMTTSQEQLATEGLDMIDRLKKNLPGTTQKQALAIIARRDPVIALVTRKALEIQSTSRKKNAPTPPRKQYWDRNPLLDKYYGQ